MKLKYIHAPASVIRRPSVRRLRRPQFQTSSLKPLGQSKPIILLGGTKVFFSLSRKSDIVHLVVVRGLCINKDTSSATQPGPGELHEWGTMVKKRTAEEDSDDNQLTDQRFDLALLLMGNHCTARWKGQRRCSGHDLRLTTMMIRSRLMDIGLDIGRTLWWTN